MSGHEHARPADRYIAEQVAENRLGALGWVEALGNGDFPGIFNLHATNFISNLLGSTGVSGCSAGRDDYFAYTYEQVMTKLDGSTEPYLKSWRLACVDHHAAALLVQGGLPALDGAPEGRYDQNYLIIVQAAAGQIHKLTEMVDTCVIETAIYRRRLAVRRARPAMPFVPELVRALPGASGSRATSLRVAEDFLVAISRPDAQAYRALLDPEVAVSIVGTTPYSGRWRGREAYLALPFDFHSPQRFEAAAYDLGHRYRIMCADDEGFCALVRNGGPLVGGCPYAQHYAITARVGGGVITEMHLHLDTALAEEAWFGNPFQNAGHRSPHAPFSIY